MENDFLQLFHEPKPILGMLHLKGDSDQDVWERMKREVDIYVNGGLDAVIVENYFGRYHHMEQALDYVRSLKLDIPYGVNCLNVDAMGFELAQKYRASFVQLDSVIGHVKPRDEETIKAFLELYRNRCHVQVLGGVRFKYQPVLSENSVETDLVLAKERCDAVCVTGDATGAVTPLEKIRLFRKTLGDFPLIVGAGMTPENMREQMEYADGAIVGSYFKHNHQDSGEVSAEHVKQVVDAVRAVRGGIK